VIDDDRLLCDVVMDCFRDTMEVYLAHTGREGIAACARKKVDVVLLDQNLPDGEGHTFCPSILKENGQAKIIFITAYPNFENAVYAIKAGAYDYILKPFELEELNLAVERALRTIALEKIEQFQNYRISKESEEAILLGEGLAPIRRLVQLAAASSAPVLITGETGTGKNVTAKCIHYAGPNPLAPFVSINCAALPESLIEAELFGCEKGAFTGATTAKKGIFEMAEGGTLLLDEIGEMPLNLQTKLLSVLEDKQIKKLGSDFIRPVNVRVIASTNSNIEEAVTGKTFRQDLYYRLSVLRIDIPPLRERKQDIPELCDYFIKKISGSEIRLPDSEMEKLVAYEWRGNIRELRNIIERAIILRDGLEIHLSGLLNAKVGHPAENVQKPLSDASIPTLEEVEKTHLQNALHALSRNYAKTARVLGISLSTLKRKIKEYGITDSV